jgi:Ankyrin repeats (3 copies)
MWKNPVQADDSFALRSAASKGNSKDVLLLLANSITLESNRVEFLDEVAPDKAEELQQIFDIRKEIAEGDEIGEELTPPIIDSQDYDTGKTALHLAAENDHVNVIRILIAANADINKKDKNQKTALSLAYDNNKGHAAALLLAVDSYLKYNDKEDRLNYVSSQCNYGESARQLLLTQLFEYSADPFINNRPY